MVVAAMKAAHVSRLTRPRSGTADPTVAVSRKNSV